MQKNKLMYCLNCGLIVYDTHMLGLFECLFGVLITAYQTTRHNPEYHILIFFGRENFKFHSGPSLFDYKIYSYRLHDLPDFLWRILSTATFMSEEWNQSVCGSLICLWQANVPTVYGGAGFFLCVFFFLPIFSSRMSISYQSPM